MNGTTGPSIVPIQASTSVQNPREGRLARENLKRATRGCTQSQQCQQAQTHLPPRPVEVYIMPCAVGSLCNLKECTPEAPDGYECMGGCGGRLHAECGEMEDEDGNNHELHRICFACVNNAKQSAISGASKAGAGKRKGAADTEEDFGDASGSSKKRAKEKGDKSASRKRLTLDEKLEILTLLDQGATTHYEISDRYGLSLIHI